jgi:hypothetical protein
VRRFLLQRDADISGVSGTGVVAEGVQFTDGRAVLRWLTEIATSGFYDSVDHLEKIHGHNGATRINWID